MLPAPGSRYPNKGLRIGGCPDCVQGPGGAGPRGSGCEVYTLEAKTTTDAIIGAAGALSHEPPVAASLAPGPFTCSGLLPNIAEWTPPARH
jgi:hypothetical protein